MVDYAAVAVVCVFAKAKIGDDYQIWKFIFYGTKRGCDDAVVT